MSGLEKLCIKCWSSKVPLARSQAGFTTCLPCGEREARKRKHTIVPLHKSNYIVPANDDEVRGINNKGGLVR